MIKLLHREISKWKEVSKVKHYQMNCFKTLVTLSPTYSPEDVSASFLFN